MSTHGHSYLHGSGRMKRNLKLLRLRRRLIERYVHRYYYKLFFWAMGTYVGIVPPTEIERHLIDLFYYLAINGVADNSWANMSSLLRWIIEGHLDCRN